MDTDTETSKVVIDPDGDVVLVLDGTELQVSSKVLSVASSVFKAMFGPHFQEGQDLSSTSPKRISFPEDDAIAMTTLCNILHHQSNKVTKIPPHSMLVGIGILCDKYDCTEAFSVWSQTWILHWWPSRSSSPHVLPILLYSFFLFNDAHSFKAVSKSVVFHTKGFIPKPENTDLMPDAVFDILQRKKVEIERQLCYDLDIMLLPILKKEYQPTHLASGSKHNQWAFCNEDGIRLWTYLKTLTDLGLWPLSTALTQRSITAICDLLAEYKENRIRNCNCPGCSIDFVSLARKAGVHAMESFEGLCLHCIKLEGTVTYSGQGCTTHNAAYPGWFTALGTKA